MKPLLEIIFEDEYFIAINKPAGVLVHRTHLAKEEETLLAVQLLRDQIGQHVSPLHRIDRPTSGVLLFGKNSESTSLLQPLFPTKQVKKFYLSLVRGHMEDHGIIDHPLRKKLHGELQEATTEFWTLSQTEIPFASSARYPSSRYSLIKVYPHTGRMHQIRRHMAHARHYVIGDNTHGDNKQNTFFRNKFGLYNMLLHAWQLEFIHPITNQKITIEAELPDYFIKILEEISICLPNSN
ncbi:pseudouridine synthase [Cecembia rubra]|uniref:tRNA pseudouridine synthase C n=1 Tax=Cecembia rubra TaxID=1485585 RepID=A0A2P8EDX4_9BACT|nr:pseudouridine synthase [Cecembia rubra]PSL07648.1 tRNA pseudouridine65 synthase [Cecembia rubra]